MVQGYRAEYSMGAEGSQPVLKQRAFTESELKEYKKDRKPTVLRKSFNDGKILFIYSKFWPCQSFLSQDIYTVSWFHDRMDLLDTGILYF